MKIGRLPFIIVLGLLLVLLFLFLNERGEDQSGQRMSGSGQPARPAGQSGLSITQIAVDPQNSNVLYVATMNAGIFKSLDQGKSWSAVNEGLKTLMVMDMVIHPRQPQRLVAGTFGGGIYRSEDGGSSWVEANEGLTNTTISQLVFHPSGSEIVYAMSPGDGVFRSNNHGQTWTSWSEGLDLLEFRSNLVFLPVPDGSATFYLGTSDGILKRKEGEPQWESTSEKLSAGPRGRQTVSLAYDPRTKTLFAGVAFQGLYSSRDMGKTWSPLGDRSEKEVIYSLMFDPSNPKVIYATSNVRGILKSADYGASWIEINNGLEGKQIKTLIRDPRDPQTFYTADLTGGGLFVSTNGGRKWTALDKGFPSVETVTQAFSARVEKEVAPVKISLSPPEAFKKCNTCHGWTEPLLNSQPNLWKVAPSRRNWETTVKRMKMMTPDLTPSEEAKIISFLDTHFGVKGSSSENKNGE